MATTPPVFSMSRNSYIDEFGFDLTEMDRAQGPRETRTHTQEVSLESKDYNNSLHRQSRAFRRPDSAAAISCFPAHFKVAELQKSLKDHKARRSWKKSIFFWKNSQDKQRVLYSAIPAPQHPGFKSRPKPTSRPVYTTIDIHISPWRSSRSTPGPLAGTMTPMRKCEAEVPYVSLYHHNQSRVHRTTPIYLVT